MKKSILLLILVITSFCSCKKQELNNYIIFSGKIENSNSDTLQLIDKSKDVLKSIILDDSKTFKDTLNLPEGYYTLINGKGRASMYLKPTYDINLTIDAKEFNKSIKYEGKGANENNYLTKKNLLLQSFGKLNYYDYYAKLPEREFLKLTDSLYNIEKSLLEKSINLDTTFYYVESKTLEFKKLSRRYSYENSHKSLTGNEDFKVSESFPDVFDDLDLSDERLLLSSYYLYHVESYLQKITSERVNIDDHNVDFILEYINTINNEVKNNSLKQELFYVIGKYNLNSSKDTDSVYNQIKPILTNDRYLSEVIDNYNAFKKLEKGAISPTFTLDDITGKSISLSDLRGQLVYIDIWATWCVPCIKEFPSLKKVEKHFEDKNIQFVSICQYDIEKKWRKMVEDKELGGMQLFAPDSEISFFKDYSIMSIPRFILIDQNGKIIDANAKRPSNPELTKEIEQYLLDFDTPNT